jgi:hypothetical protein
MPFNSSGVYTVPAGTTATDATTIYAEPYNNFIADLKRSVSLILPRTVTGPMRADLPMGANQIVNLAENTGSPYELWRGGDVIEGSEPIIRTSQLTPAYDIIPFDSTLDLTGTTNAVILVEGGGVLREITGPFEGPRFLVFTGGVNFIPSSTFIFGGPAELPIPAEGGIGVWPISSDGSGTLDAWQVDFIYTGEDSPPEYDPPYCYSKYTQGITGLWFCPDTDQWPYSYVYDTSRLVSSATGQKSSYITGLVDGRLERFTSTFYPSNDTPGTPGYSANPSALVMPNKGRNSGTYYFEVQLLTPAGLSVRTHLYFGLVSCLGLSLDFKQNTDVAHYVLDTNDIGFFVRGWFGGQVQGNQLFSGWSNILERLGVSVNCDTGECNFYYVYGSPIVTGTLFATHNWPQFAGRTILPYCGALYNLNNASGASTELPITYEFATRGTEFQWAGHPGLPWVS